MRKLMTLLALTGAFALAAPAASIDGKWTAEVNAAGGKRGAKKDAAKKSPAITLDLKSSGSTLTGSVSAGGGRRSRAMEIKEGKIEGDRFTFLTVQSGKKGETKWKWEGTVQGDELKGTRTKDGARRGASFTAKRG